MDSTKPDFLEVSNHFFHDAVDLEIRYRYCMDSDGPLFFTPRSRRIKCFIDLRMGVESILKSIICYFENNDRKGKNLVNWIEKYKHNTQKMLTKAKPHMPEDILVQYTKYIEDLNDLPVGLRYRLDSWDFRNSKEDFYYATVGSDTWLHELHQALVKLIDFSNENLKKHSRIINMADLYEEFKKKRHNKYINVKDLGENRE